MGKKETFGALGIVYEILALGILGFVVGLNICSQ